MVSGHDVLVFVKHFHGWSGRVGCHDQRLLGSCGERCAENTDHTDVPPHVTVSARKGAQGKTAKRREWLSLGYKDLLLREDVCRVKEGLIPAG